MFGFEVFYSDVLRFVLSMQDYLSSEVYWNMRIRNAAGYRVGDRCYSAGFARSLRLVIPTIL